jgi:hypothetical protein
MELPSYMALDTEVSTLFWADSTTREVNYIRYFIPTNVFIGFNKYGQAYQHEAQYQRPTVPYTPGE